MKRQKGITIYPKQSLRDWVNEESKRESRSMNNLILFIINKYKEVKQNGKQLRTGFSE